MSNQRHRRDFGKILATVQALASSQLPHALPERKGRGADVSHHGVGLKLGELEDARWSVTSSVARSFLEQARLPYEGRRAGVIYSWPSIFRAEGVAEDVARNATRQSHPELFEDLLDTKQSAAFLGYRDSSSIRKLLASGDIPKEACIVFGSREVYRIRVAALRQLRRVPTARIV